MDIDQKLDKLDSHLERIDITLAKQSVVLEDHVKRTTLLEARVIPIEDHVKFLRNLGKFIVYLSSISGLLMVIIKLFGKH